MDIAQIPDNTIYMQVSEWNSQRRDCLALDKRAIGAVVLLDASFMTLRCQRLISIDANRYCCNVGYGKLTVERFQTLEENIMYMLDELNPKFQREQCMRRFLQHVVLWIISTGHFARPAVANQLYQERFP